MKKSSFLHKPKDMISKSFNPAKCKTALKLAASRMKLMKNKKEAQVKQMKRELAQLLESGQDQTARIRVEHVIREEKMMAAYELVDIYCELIVARLPIIESQKNCPIDLKEAISSVIFASPRCGDIPELVDAKKHFSAKYGKEFVTSAIELRPNCGVSRLLVEKLSAKAPDVQTKVKVLTAIAEEHNVKWDPKSLGQSDALPSDDLLNGPNTLEKSSAVNAEAPSYVAPDFQASPSHPMVQNQPLNLSKQNVRLSQGTQNLASRHNSIDSNRVSSAPHAQTRPSGVGTEREEISHLFQEEESTSFSGQGWNMDFKDATSAAQAAAESAERASMAARAAAELSGRGRIATQQPYFSEAHNSIDDVLRDERTAKHSTSNYTSYFPRDSDNSSFSDRQPGFPDKPMNKSEQDSGERLSERSHQDGHDNRNIDGQKDSFEDDAFARSVELPDDNSQKKIFKEEADEVKRSMQKPPGKSETEGANHLQEGFSSRKFDYSVEENIRKQSSVLSSSSHSSISDTDDRFSNSGHQMFGYDAAKDPSVVIDEEHHHRDILQPSYQASAGPAIFDDSGSDGDDIELDTGFQHEESNFYFASPDRNSPSHLSTSMGSESLVFRTGKSPESYISEFPSKNHSFPEFSESLEAPLDDSQAVNLGPVTFDDSDGAISENEIEMSYSGNHGTQHSRDLPTGQNQSLGFSDPEMHSNTNRRTETVLDSEEKFGFGESSASQSSFRLGKSQPESSNAGSQSSFQNSMDGVDDLVSSKSKPSLVHDNIGSAHIDGSQIDDEFLDYGKELNFKRLTGGFRQKGYTPPPYMRSQLDDISTSAKKVSDDSPSTIQQSAAASTVESSVDTGKSKGVGSGRSSRVAFNHSDTDSDSSREELKKQPASHRQESVIQDAGKDVKMQSRLRGSVTYFDSESSDSEDDSAKQVFAGRSHLGSGFSRRTKASKSSSTSVSNSRAGSSPGVPSNFDTERNSTARFYGSKTRQEPQSRTRNSEQPISPKAASNPSLLSKVSLPKENKKASGVQQPRSSEQKVETSESTENQKTSAMVPLNFDTKRDSTARFYGSKTRQGPQSQTRNSDQQRISEQPSSPKAASNPSLLSKVSLPKENKKSSGVQQPPSSEQKVETSESTENQKTSAGVPLNFDTERNSTARFYGSKTRQGPQSQTRNSDQRRISEQPSSPKAASNPSLLSKVSLPKENKKSSGVQQPPSSGQKVETSESTENQKASARVPLNFDTKRDSTARFYGSQTRQGPQSQIRNSEQQRISEQPSSPKAASNPSLLSKGSLPKENKKSSGVQQPPSSEQKVETSESTENHKTASGSTISKEDSLKKASHVHPKLPDYDTLAAKFQALRMNRQ